MLESISRLIRCVMGRRWLKIKMDPGVRRDDGWRHSRSTHAVIPAHAGIHFRPCSKPSCSPIRKIKRYSDFRLDDGKSVRYGCTTVIVAGDALPTPRMSGRYMSSTSEGGTVYVPGVTARTR